MLASIGLNFSKGDKEKSQDAAKQQPSKVEVMSRRISSDSESEFRPIRTRYISNPIAIPDSFLTSTPVEPVTLRHVPFASSEIPEYAGRLAVSLDNVLSPEECQQLLTLAEASVPMEDGVESPWRPALLNMGVGWEMMATDVRNNDRIIWDEQTVVDRLWQRCLNAEGLKDLMSRTPKDNPGLSGRWVFERVNNRMRFLKYTPGQYFKPHCDGPYYCANDDGKECQTHYTLHLYLNDSAKESALGNGHLGGATSFLSYDEKRRLDINPKAGSVLIFQHAGLYHEGEAVISGTKYTMRTDILYRWETN